MKRGVDPLASLAQGDLRLVGRSVPLDRHGNAILRFRGPSGTHAGYAAADVVRSELLLRDGLAPSLDPALFKDAYVLFGATAPGLLDLRPAPVSGVYPGVEIVGHHARQHHQRRFHARRARLGRGRLLPRPGHGGGRGPVPGRFGDRGRGPPHRIRHPARGPRLRGLSGRALAPVRGPRSWPATRPRAAYGCTNTSQKAASGSSSRPPFRNISRPRSSSNSCSTRSSSSWAANAVSCPSSSPTCRGSPPFPKALSPKI